MELEVLSAPADESLRVRSSVSEPRTYTLEPSLLMLLPIRFRGDEVSDDGPDENPILAGTEGNECASDTDSRPLRSLSLSRSCTAPHQFQLSFSPKPFLTQLAHNNHKPENQHSECRAREEWQGWEWRTLAESCRVRTAARLAPEGTGALSSSASEIE